MIEFSTSDIYKASFTEFANSFLGATFTPAQFNAAVQAYEQLVIPPISAPLLDPNQFTTITYTNGGNSTTTETTQLVGVESIRFIRQRKLAFRATDLKPNTVMYAFFDDVPVSEFCTDLAGERILQTDSNGIIQGFFNIPPFTFNTGTKVFRLQDTQVLFSEIPAGSLTSSAQAAYYTSGIRSISQKTINSVTTQTVQRVIQL